MAKGISYVQAVEFTLRSVSTFVDPVDLARSIDRLAIPACVIHREPNASPHHLISASSTFLGRGILPIIEIYPGDEEGPMRNLAETVCIGTLMLRWKDGLPDFAADKMLEVFNSTGRHRISMDIHVDPGEATLDRKLFRSFLTDFAFLAKKYGHVQTVYLANLAPDSDDEVDDYEGIGVFKAIHRGCPHAMASMNPRLWMAKAQRREIAADLGIISVKLTESGEIGVNSNPIGSIQYFAKSNGMTLVPRLPLTFRLYGKGFYSFEVGKVLDLWVNRSAYHNYSKRPEWLED